jgi:AcrR family transcriptional regulator
MPRPISAQRTRQRETTRRHLIETGLRVAASSGFSRTSTASIAKASGLAHGTVFVHFPTRDALVIELVAEVGRAISQQLASLDHNDVESASSEKHWATLPEVLSAHLAALAQHEVLYSRLLCEAAVLPLSARAHIFALQSGIACRLRAAYSRALAQGSVRALDSITLSNMWIGLTNHYLLNRELFAPDASVIEKFGATLQAQLLALIQL